MNPYYTFDTIVIEHGQGRDVYRLSLDKWIHIEGHTWNSLWSELERSPRQECKAEEVIAAIIANIGLEGSRIYALNHCVCPDDVVSIQHADLSATNLHKFRTSEIKIA